MPWRPGSGLFAHSVLVKSGAAGEVSQHLFELGVHDLEPVLKFGHLHVKFQIFSLHLALFLLEQVDLACQLVNSGFALSLNSLELLPELALGLV